MRQRCLKVVVLGALLAEARVAFAADGPLSRLRQRWGSTPATQAAPPVDDALQRLIEVNPVVVRPSPPKAAASGATSLTPDQPGTVRVTSPTSTASTQRPRSVASALAAPAAPAPDGAAVPRSSEPRPYPSGADARHHASESPITSDEAIIELTGLLQPLTPPLYAEPASAPPMEPVPADVSPGAAPGIAPQPLPGEITSGASAPSVTCGFTLEQAEQLALANNPTRHAAHAIVQKAIGTRSQISKYPNPTIGYNADDIGDEGTAGNQGVFVQQTIMLGRKLELNEHVANWEVQALNWQAEAQRQRVCNDVREQFYITLGAQRMVALAEEWQATAAEVSRLTTARFNAIGNLEDLGAAKNEVLLSNVQSQRAILAYDNAQAELTAAWNQLACLMGQPLMPYTRLQDTLEATSGPRDLELARQQLVSLSPVLAQARAEVQRASWRIQREQAQPIPNVQLQLIGAHSATSGSELLSIQAGLPVPVFNRNEGNVLRASADYQRACWNVRRLELALQSQLAEQFQQYQTAANTVFAIEHRIRRTFEEHRAQVEANRDVEGLHSGGVYSGLDGLLAAQAEYENNRDAIEALVQLRSAEIALDGLLLSGAFNELQDNEMDDTNRWNALSGQ